MTRRGDVEGLDILFGQPALEFLGDKLRTGIGTDKLGRAVLRDGRLHQPDNVA